MAWKRVDRESLSWAFYDWANSAFATTIMAGFFPLFFKDYWDSASSATQSTFHLGIGTSASGLLVAVCAPIFGAIADRGNAKRRFLLTLAGLGMALTAGLFFIGDGQWLPAIITYGLAAFCFMSANTFYDSLIVGVSTDKTKEFVSALGYSMGYLGGGILFALNVTMYTFPEWFGLADGVAAVKWSFLSVAVWWAAFSIPLVLFVREPQVPDAFKGGGGGRAVQEGVRQLVRTIGELRGLRMLVVFLCAYWLYIDGVHTIVRMAVDYGRALGFDQTTLITALLITQFVGFPATIVVGRLGERIGPKNGIYICIGVYMVVTVFGYFMDDPTDFYVLAITIGLVQGGAQALSRSFYVSLIPKARSGQFFGFYNMLGKFATVLGPGLVGVVAAVTGSNQISILSLLVLFGTGLFLLRFVDLERGKEQVAVYEAHMAARPPAAESGGDGESA